MNIILKALGAIDEKFISEADEALPKLNIKKIILPLVACFVLAVGVFAWQFTDDYFAKVESDNGITEGAGETVGGQEFSVSRGICIVSKDKYLIVLDNSPTVMINKTNNKNVFSDLNTGDLIEIKYGAVMETYPAKTGIYSVKLIQKGNIQDVPQDILDSLNELNWEIKE